MATSILVTGGAGFIGSHVVESLVAAGHTVTVVDALLRQVHGPDCRQARFLSGDVPLVRANLCDREQWEHVLAECEVVVHLAADVGVGQSMYEISRYVRNNCLATAVLLEAMLPHRRRLKRLVVASSMSIYGEGAYWCQACGPVYPGIRLESQLQRNQWEPICPDCRRSVEAIPTTEDKPLKPTSIYAVNKRDQEEMCLSFGQAYGIPTVALRFFNVYGPRQSLSNPYTGVVAIFGSRLLNGNPPRIFEDGRQCRDFVHVGDVAQAVTLAAESDVAFEVFNVGTGRARSIGQVAEALQAALGSHVRPEVAGQFRAGDIRHCFADISKAQRLLRYQPQVKFEDGIRKIVGWMQGESAVDCGDEAYRELQTLGLSKGSPSRT